MIKPDAVKNRCIGNIIADLEANHFEVKSLRMMILHKGEIEEIYAPHKGKPWFENHVNFINSGPVVGILLYMDPEFGEAIPKLKKLVGSTKSWEADRGTIRYKYGSHHVITENAIHVSDSINTMVREIRPFNFLGILTSS